MVHTKNLSVLLWLILIGGWAVTATAQSIERIEPTCWWAGMKSPQLQLLVYGKDIGGLYPKVDYPGVKVLSADRVSNANYLFVNLHLSPNTAPGEFNIEFQKEGKTVLTKAYSLLPRVANSAMREGFNSSDVMYLITPDRYVNGDESNDRHADLSDQPNRKHPGGRHGGDIKGIADNLDYLQSLGMTTIWLNPVLENNQPEYSYHGYSTTDYYRVDLRYGTNEEYRKLAEDAQKRGIKMIMDMIVNHCGSEHWWMKDLPTDDWVNFQYDAMVNEHVITNHRRQTLQDPYAAASDRLLHTDGWFVPTMPDLNQRNPLMATYLIQNSIWWVEYAHLAGIRMDTYSYPDMYFMTEWTRRMMEEYPNLNIVGEEWSENPVVVSHWQRGKKNPSGYISYLPSVMDFPLQNALVKSLKEEESPFAGGFITLYRMLMNDVVYPAPNDLVVFLDNHDMSRFYTQMDEDKDLLKLGMAYLATTRGIPQLYYGTEVLMSNKGTDDHGVIRSDFPGGWKGDEKDVFKNKGLTAEEKDMLDFTKKLFNWRKTAKVVHEGKLTHYAPENGVYVYFRYNENKKVMVILNKNDKPIDFTLYRFEEHLGGKKSGLNILDGKRYEFPYGEITLPARTPLILELE